MERSRLKQWMWLIAYSIGLIIIVVHSGFIAGEIVRFLKQLGPLIGGVAIAFVLNKPYERLKHFLHTKVNMPAKAAGAFAMAGVYLGVAGAAVILFRLVLPNLIENVQMLFSNTDSYIEEFEQFAEKILGWFNVRSLDKNQIMDILQGVVQRISEAAGDILPKLAALSGKIISFGAAFTIAVAISIYILGSKKRLLFQANRLAHAYIPERMYGRFIYVFSTVVRVFDNYISSQVLEACILGSLCTAGMFLLRLEYAGLVGVIIAVTALVPVFGAYIGGSAAFILLLFISAKKAVIFIIFLVALQQFEDNVIYPRVVGRRIGLPALWVLAGVSIGGGYFGFLGVLLAVPVVSVLYTLLRNDVRRREKKKINLPGQS